MKMQHQAFSAVFRVKKDAPRTRGDSTTRHCKGFVPETIAFLPFSFFVCGVVVMRQDRSPFGEK